LTPHSNAISFLFHSPCIFSLIPHLLLLRPTLTLGVKAKVELKSSIPIGAIAEISPKGFTIGVKAEKKNNFFNPSLYRPNLAPRQKKDTFQVGEPICNPWGPNVAAITYFCSNEIHIVGSNLKPNLIFIFLLYFISFHFYSLFVLVCE
jgi:hypothetical protein